MSSPSDAPEVVYATDRARLEAEASGASPPTPEVEAKPTAEQIAAAQGKTVQQVERDILAAPRSTPADDMRAKIAAKASASRGTVDSSESAMQAGVQLMLADAAPEPIADGGGEPTLASRTERMELEAAGGAAPRARAAAPPAIDRPENTFTLTVDGRDIVFPASEVLKAGVQTLQKERAADYGMQRVALAEQSILTRSAALDARAAEIERSRSETPGRPAARADLPSGGTDSAGGTEEALTALLDSDVKGAAKALDRIVAETAEAAVRRAVGSHQPAAPATAEPTAADRIWPQEVRDRVGAQIGADFPELTRNPALANQFTARMKAELDNPTNQAGRVDLGVLAAILAREVVRSPAPLPAPSSVQDELAARRSLAARVPTVPTGGVPRSVAPVPSGPAPMTKSEIVENMRKARGQA